MSRRVLGVSSGCPEGVECLNARVRGSRPGVPCGTGCLGPEVLVSGAGGMGVSARCPGLGCGVSPRGGASVLAKGWPRVRGVSAQCPRGRRVSRPRGAGAWARARGCAPGIPARCPRGCPALPCTSPSSSRCFPPRPRPPARPAALPAAKASRKLPPPRPGAGSAPPSRASAKPSQAPRRPPARPVLPGPRPGRAEASCGDRPRLHPRDRGAPLEAGERGVGRAVPPGLRTGDPAGDSSHSGSGARPAPPPRRPSRARGGFGRGGRAQRD